MAAFAVRTDFERMAEIVDMDPAERDFVLAEMGFNPSAWRPESEVLA